MDAIELLHLQAAKYGLFLTQSKLDLFKIYFNELIEWNLKINLTGLSTQEKIINELFLDSLIPTPFLPQQGRLLDVGSGAGFPGMVIKIYNPDLHVHLLEPISKRTRFLKHVVRSLGLNNIDILKERIDSQSGILHPCGYDIITSRALSELPQIIEWCAPFLLQNGILVGFLGIDAEGIIQSSKGILKEHGLVLLTKIPYSLPGKNASRTTVILKKQKL